MMTRTSQVAWRPDQQIVAQANITRFMREHGIASYEELIRRSTTEIEWFWDALPRALGVEWCTPYTRVMDTASGIPWTEWYVGGTLNITHNCLDRHAGGVAADRPALIAETEDGQLTSWTYSALAERVSRIASVMRGLGIRRGETVGIYMPMIADVVTILLACLKIGAVAIPSFPALRRERWRRGCETAAPDSCLPPTMGSDGEGASS